MTYEIEFAGSDIQVRRCRGRRVSAFTPVGELRFHRRASSKSIVAAPAPSNPLLASATTRVLELDGVGGVSRSPVDLSDGPLTIVNDGISRRVELTPVPAFHRRDAGAAARGRLPRTDAGNRPHGPRQPCGDRVEPTVPSCWLLEAMKMEHVIRAPQAGRVAEISVAKAIRSMKAIGLSNLSRQFDAVRRPADRLPGNKRFMSPERHRKRARNKLGTREESSMFQEKLVCCGFLAVCWRRRLLTAGAAWAEDITVYTALEDDQLAAYKEAFEKNHPDIKINWVRNSTGPITARLLAEKGNRQADVVWGLAATSLLVLDAEGMLEGYAPKDDRPGQTELPRCRQSAEVGRHGRLGVGHLLQRAGRSGQGRAASRRPGPTC